MGDVLFHSLLARSTKLLGTYVELEREYFFSQYGSPMPPQGMPGGPMGRPLPNHMGGPMLGPMGGAPHQVGGYAPYGGGYPGAYGAMTPAAKDPMWGYFTALAGQV